MPATKFRDLAIGSTFDFVAPTPAYNSFYHICRKTGARTYEYYDGEWCTARVGSINCQVYNVRPN